MTPLKKQPISMPTDNAVGPKLIWPKSAFNNSFSSSIVGPIMDPGTPCEKYTHKFHLSTGDHTKAGPIPYPLAMTMCEIPL